MYLKESEDRIVKELEARANSGVSPLRMVGLWDIPLASC